MPGNRIGGKKAAAKNRELYGADFYARIGAKGGRNGHTGGFAANRELARAAGRKGGMISRRRKADATAIQHKPGNQPVTAAQSNFDLAA